MNIKDNSFIKIRFLFEMALTAMGKTDSTNILECSLYYDSKLLWLSSSYIYFSLEFTNCGRNFRKNFHRMIRVGKEKISASHHPATHLTPIILSQIRLFHSAVQLICQKQKFLGAKEFSLSIVCIFFRNPLPTRFIKF